MRYGIIGAGRSGRGAAELLVDEGHDVLLSDSMEEDERFSREYRRLEGKGVRLEFGGHSDALLEVDRLILSPGVPPTIDIVGRTLERGIPISNEIEIAAERCRGRILGITGTNGKTTTTELVGHCCRKAGRETWVAGNVGTPFSEIAAEVSDEGIVALELSSFQLERIDRFRPDVAVLLNLSPDHMDRYETIEEYGAAKLRITKNMDEAGRVVYNRDDSWLRRIASIDFLPATSGFSIEEQPDEGEGLSGWVEKGMLRVALDRVGDAEDVIPAVEIGIRGPHNLANALAATVALRAIGLTPEEIAEGLRSFSPLPHRLEEVATIDGVLWVNDSKGTNTDALSQALRSFSRPIVLIAGGQGKKNDYASLRELVGERVKGVVAIGEDCEKIAEAFDDVTTVVRGGRDFQSALDAAAEMAIAGDVVLLSPACASFDMFRNFEHRGDRFRELVLARK